MNDAAQRFIDLLGPDQVDASAPARDAAGATTFATEVRVAAILRPSGREQVQAAVRLANQLGVRLYPISTGKNWGYGSRVPTADGSFLLDLSRLNRIVDYDERLAYVTVEPGVTQRQLHEFLRGQRSQLWLDATGSSPDASLIGNTLERGFGHTPYGEHAAWVANFEVVLPTGECVHTGFDRFPNATTASVYRWAVGPYLDGLFSQSNLGIVTRMTCWLMPAPEYFQAFYFTVRAADDLGPLVDALRPLRLSGTLRSAVHLANDYKVLSGVQQYPWKEANDRTPLPPDVLAEFARTWRFGAWNASGGLYGTRAQVRVNRDILRRQLRGLDGRFQFMDDAKLALARRFVGAASWMSGMNMRRLLPIIEATYGLMKGVPTTQPLTSAYWRKRTPPPPDPDPDRDRCGLLWCAPVAPLTGEHAMRIDRFSRGVFARHGFEAASSFTLLTDRALGCVLSLTYDRDVPGEDARAMTCYEDLLEGLRQHGYYPYRLGIQSMRWVTEGAGEDYTALLHRLKRALDPNGVLSPGRYL